MARKASIGKKLEDHILKIEASISKLNEDLEVAKANYNKYLANREVIESILNLQESPELNRPKRKYTKRAKPAEAQPE